MASAHGTPNTALRTAAAIPLTRGIVADCLDVDERPDDVVFARAFAHGLASLDASERGGRLAGITGHVAESVIEVVLTDHGWTPVWHFVGPGRHGVDLLMLGPGAERVFAIEVKGTLRRLRWPRLRSADLMQMDVAWLDRTDNPAMGEWEIEGADVYGAVVVVNFDALAYKVVLTRDLVHWVPVIDEMDLDALEWL